MQAKTDEDIGQLIFTLLETVDALAELPTEKLAGDANVISGAALGLMLIVAGLSGPIGEENLRVKVN